jgi:hypothetical protein
MKICTKCGVEKSLDEFYKSKMGKDGYRGDCKTCHKLVVSSKIASSRKLHNDTRTRKRYGLSEGQYEAMLEDQAYKCFICNEYPTTKALHVDHDHACCPGKTSCGSCVRGLLCHNCNVALGLLKENPVIIKSMLDYIML